jgi:hypothetical protein
MKWSVFGKILAKVLPSAVEFAQDMAEPGAKKRDIAIQFAHDELHELAPDLASHPKVLEAVGKANDAIVNLHNVVAHVEDDLAKARPTQIPPPPGTIQ